MKKYSFFITLFLIIILIFSDHTAAYKGKSHRLISDEAIQYLINDGEITNDSDQIYIEDGSVNEDGPLIGEYRYNFHFLPHLNHEDLYSTCNALDWAFGSDTCRTVVYGIPYDRENEFNWDSAETGAGYLGAGSQEGWTALGHVTHLLEDMASPAHVRNDPHPPLDTDPFEKWAKKIDDINLSNIHGLVPVEDPQSLFEQLQSYTQNNFFSNDTCFHSEFPGPEVSETISSFSNNYFWDTNSRRIAHKTKSYRKSVYKGVEDRTLCNIDDRIAKEQANEIMPIATQYAASLINFYYDNYIDDDGDTYPENQGDCDDSDAAINPEAEEVCDGKNNDCDGSTPDGFAEVWLGEACDGSDNDLCLEGEFVCSGGVQRCSDDTGDTVEICDDGFDNNCNGQVDEGCQIGLMGYAHSVCNPLGRCEIQFGVEDPGQVADDVNVTGPKIVGSFDLIYGGAGPGSWYGGHDFGTDLPDTPATYKVHIFKDGIDHIQDVVVQSFNLAYASNLSPVGTASGDITFSWTGVSIPSALYYVQFNAWNSPKSTDTSVPYTGDPLTPGEEYWYCIAVEDAHGSENLACESFVYEDAPVTITRVSVGYNNVEANGDSFHPTINADGRFIAFISNASNLIPGGDTNGYQDSFVYDRLTGVTEQINVSSDGEEGEGHAAVYSISGDGRYTGFTTNASNLAPNDTIGRDVFVRDRLTGTTERVSVASDGSQANSVSQGGYISADGRFVAFYSGANNLVPDDTGLEDVFVRDRLTGTTERVSIASDGSEGSGFPTPNYTTIGQPFSANGEIVVFSTKMANLVPEDTNNIVDVFAHNRLSGVTERISFALDGTEADGWSAIPAVSANGRFVAFQSTASNIVINDTNATADIFVHDRLTGTTERVSVAFDNSEANGDNTNPMISKDSRFVVFQSDADNLVQVDTNGTTDIFVHDRLTGTIERVSVAFDNSEADNYSTGGRISGDGQLISFQSVATNLVPNDTNGYGDIFVVPNPLF